MWCLTIMKDFSATSHPPSCPWRKKQVIMILKCSGGRKCFSCFDAVLQSKIQISKICNYSFIAFMQNITQLNFSKTHIIAPCAFYT